MAIGSIVNRVVLSYRRLFPAFPDKQTSARARHFRKRQKQILPTHNPHSDHCTSNFNHCLALTCLARV